MMIPELKDLQQQYRIIALLAVWKWLAIVLIVVIWMIVQWFSPTLNPVDDKLIRSRELVQQLLVVDERSNGFRVNYATKESVTKERLVEIQRRSSVNDSLNNLKRLAPLKFGNMLLTDIYDFADYAIMFDPADVYIHNIFVYGPDKENLYIGRNPRIGNPAKWIDPGTLQGLLYITADDIYSNNRDHGRVYRYYKCQGIHQISETDEHFSHFSEEERLY